MGVLVDVTHPCDGEVDLVLAAVKDAHREATLVQPLHDERPGRAGPADHERARLGHWLIPPSKFNSPRCRAGGGDCTRVRRGC